LDALPPAPPAVTAAPKPEAAAPTPARVEPAQLLEKKDPVYPSVGRDVRLSGNVEVHFHIRTDGTVDHVSVVSGNAILAQSAVAAVQTWRYKPAMMNGIPVETESNAVLSFNP
jgi:protein TonB